MMLGEMNKDPLSTPGAVAAFMRVFALKSNGIF